MRSVNATEPFEVLGGVPKVVLADRMGCLKGGVVANVVVPTPDYVRFATHYRFRPGFCEAADPESKGTVENLVGYAKKDLMVPLQMNAAPVAQAAVDLGVAKMPDGGAVTPGRAGWSSPCRRPGRTSPTPRGCRRRPAPCAR